MTQAQSLTGAAARGGFYVLTRRLLANVIRIETVAVLARKLGAWETRIQPAFWLNFALASCANPIVGTTGAVIYNVKARFVARRALDESILLSEDVLVCRRRRVEQL